MIDDASRERFRQTIWDYYASHGRDDLPWRQPESSGSFDPYKIMVSEIMLQQTQVSRVTDKYQQFLALFPSVDVLASSELGDVLRAWSGLGYNRRARFLHMAAQNIVRNHSSTFPQTIDALVALPGIGKNTAGAILAYAFNLPVEFVETNIRTVYIHHFFEDKDKVDDKEILNMLSVTMDRGNPREWYWALMDYGSHLKKSGIRLNSQSKHYTKQSTFQGSKRQIRGEVLRQLGARSQTRQQLATKITDSRTKDVIEDLLHEGLIKECNDKRLTL